MRIAIIGTRGIPNRYGGFEQFTEYIAPMLVERGYELYVYNSSSHPYKGTQWKGVNIIAKADPEVQLGTIGQFVYDFNCIMDARRRNFDIILQLGYTSSSIWSFCFPQRSWVITNMDGFEWKRAKYSRPVQWFLKHAEKWAALYSDFLVADSGTMREYIQRKYRRNADYIPYGATVFDRPDESVLEKFGLTCHSYNMLVARIEPENNIESIIRGCLASDTNAPLLIIGNHQNKFGRYLTNKYIDKKIIFYGAVYDLEMLNQLRYHSRFYFHGHSVGGTNPSLLEAMASQSLVVAHDNVFNRAVLEHDAYYFRNSNDITALLNTGPSRTGEASKINNNLEKIKTRFSWEHVADQLENVFMQAMEQGSLQKPDARARSSFNG
jgi:glycosyltransferase involved in cell wall biosynthesis